MAKKIEVLNMFLLNFWKTLRKSEVPAWVKRLSYKKQYGEHIYYGRVFKYRVTWSEKLDYSRGREGHHMGQDTGMEYPVIKYCKYERKNI